MKTKKLVIVGVGETADIAYEYFTHDSTYEVVAFSVNKEFLKKPISNGLPVVEFESIESKYPSTGFEVFIAISSVRLNRSRAKLFKAAKAKGYTCANYVSSKAFVWRNVTLGENVFIYENCTLQHHVSVGNNVIIWSGSYIGHRSVIKDHVYISPQCAVAGFCEIGEYSFLGINSTCNDEIKIARDNIIASGAVVIKNTEPSQVMIGCPAKASAKTSYEAFNVLKEEI